MSFRYILILERPSLVNQRRLVRWCENHDVDYFFPLEGVALLVSPSPIDADSLTAATSRMMDGPHIFLELQEVGGWQGRCAGAKNWVGPFMRDQKPAAAPE